MKKPLRLILFVLLAAAAFFAAVALTTQIAKTRTLSTVYEEQISGKKIKSVEYARYEDEPFMSVVLDRRYTDSPLSQPAEIISKINEYRVSPMFNSQTTSEVLIVKFRDGSEITSFIDGTKLGLDHGKVWVRGVDKKELLKGMKKVDLVKNVK